MSRRLLLLLPLAACGGTPGPEQIRAVCEAERTRRGASRLLPADPRPECQAPQGPTPR